MQDDHRDADQEQTDWQHGLDEFEVDRVRDIVQNRRDSGYRDRLTLRYDVEAFLIHRGHWVGVDSVAEFAIPG